MAGYSGTPLVKKLGIKPGARAAFIGAPANFAAQLELPPGVTLLSKAAGDLDFILLFTRTRKDLLKSLPRCARQIKPAGMIWLSWPKQSSGVQTDLTGNIVREIGLTSGLVDVKVCAIDEIWSGLKFVYRLKDRVS